MTTLTAARRQILDGLLADLAADERCDEWMRADVGFVRAVNRRLGQLDAAEPWAGNPDTSIPSRSNMEVACSAVWDARRPCVAWGAPGPHGCKFRPGHDGDHRCPCGSRSAAEPDPCDDDAEIAAALWDESGDRP